MTELSFREWLKRRRNVLGLTQAQLAQQLGCSTIALRKIEAEDRRPSAQIVERLADLFDIAPNQRSTFLRFARGDWQSMPSTPSEDAAWRMSATRTAPHLRLPMQLTSFIGREKEIAAVKELVTSQRLTTLTGAGGTGKTRLGQQVAVALFNEFDDGFDGFFITVRFVDNVVPALLRQADFKCSIEPGGLWFGFWNEISATLNTPHMDIANVRSTFAASFVAAVPLDHQVGVVEQEPGCGADPDRA